MSDIAEEYRQKKLAKLCKEARELCAESSFAAPRLLAEVEQALDDWIVTYAADHCDPAQVRAAWKRIMDNGGTIAYVTDLRERVHSANTVYTPSDSYNNDQTKHT